MAAAIGYDRAVSDSDRSRPAARAVPLIAGWPADPRARAVLIAAITAIAIGFGVVAIKAERHYADLAASGADLNPVATLIGDGSGARTAWIGWAAAVLFALSTLRVLRGNPEPPAGVDVSASVAAMRAALRRELDLVRRALTAVGLLCALEVGRAALFAAEAVRTPGLARDRLGWTVLEVGGLVAATAVLALWCAGFRRQCRDLGAL